MSYTRSGTLVSRRKETPALAPTPMNFEDVTLSAINITQKDKNCMIPFPQSTESGQIHRGTKWHGGWRGPGMGIEVSVEWTPLGRGSSEDGSMPLNCLTSLFHGSKRMV